MNSSSHSINIVQTVIKKTERSRQMYHIFRIIHLSSKIFGMMCYSISYDEEKRPKRVYITIYDITWFLILLGIRIFSIHFYYHLVKLNFSTNIYLFLEGVAIICIAICFILIFDSIFDIKNRLKMFKIFKKFNSIDFNLRLFNVNFDNSKHLKFIIYFTTITILINVALSVHCAYVFSSYIVAHGSNASFIKMIISMLFIYGMIIVMNNYTFCLMYVTSRFRLINKCLNKIMIQSKIKNYEYEIRILRRTYDGLADVIKDINSCFAFQVNLLRCN